MAKAKRRSDRAAGDRAAGDRALVGARGGVVERSMSWAGDVVWRELKHRPYVGVVVATGAGLGVAMLLGAAEVAIAVGAGYAAYQILQKDVPPSKAVREAAKIEREIVPG